MVQANASNLPSSVYRYDEASNALQDISQGPLHINVNALGYNPRDNYLYATRLPIARDGTIDPTGKWTGIYRLGKNAGDKIAPMSMNDTAPDDLRKHIVYLSGYPDNTGAASGAFDRAGNYFLAQSNTSRVFRIKDLHTLAPDSSAHPTAHAEEIERIPETDLPNGFSAPTQAQINAHGQAITDFAVHPTESRNTQSVLYGMGYRDPADGKWYLYRYRISNPSNAIGSADGPRVHVSRKEVSGFVAGNPLGDASLINSAFFVALMFNTEGKLFLYAFNGGANGKFFRMDPSNANLEFVQPNAPGVRSADGASCIASIIANDLDLGSFSNATDTTTTVKVIGNDTAYGQPVVLEGAETNASLKTNWTPVSVPTGGSLTLNPDGTITIPQHAPPGVYKYEYEICTEPATNPATCDTAVATVEVKVNNPSITADNDHLGTITPGNSSSESVITGDTVNGQPVVLNGPGANASLNTNWNKLSGPNGGNLTLNPDGTVSVPPGAPAGTYEYEYEICIVPATTPPTCTKAKVTVVVPAAAIVADNDHLGTIAPDNSSSESIITGDTVNGQPVVLNGPGANASLNTNWNKLSGPNGGNLTLNPDGTVSVPPGAPAGTYEYEYEICIVPATTPPTCTKAKVTVVVSTAPATGTAVPVPMDAPWAILLAVLGIAGMTQRMRKRRR
ncbi:hypothetical protein ABFV80_001651 [Vandammella animalimorsus]|uniref:DUF6923 family protein n=1 Tax=Vandammella animalimorsus TaxID=2029117 RepID=UPI00325B75C9